MISMVTAEQYFYIYNITLVVGISALLCWKVFAIEPL